MINIEPFHHVTLKGFSFSTSSSSSSSLINMPLYILFHVIECRIYIASHFIKVYTTSQNISNYLKLKIKNVFWKKNKCILNPQSLLSSNLRFAIYQHYLRLSLCNITSLLRFSIIYLQVFWYFCYFTFWNWNEKYLFLWLMCNFLLKIYLVLIGIILSFII